MTLSAQVLKASKYSILAEIVSKLISPIAFVALTRILSPNDFGVVAVATTILGFVYLVTDLGVSKVIIQESGSKEYLDKVNTAGFWFNALLGVLLLLIMVLFSDNIAFYFNSPDSANVVKVMSLQVLFFSLSAVQDANKKKNLDFKFLFYLRLITTGVPVVISIPLAFVGYGYWAIVIGQVFGSFLTTIALWYYSSWRPSFSFDTKVFYSILSKSIWVSLEQIFIWIPIGLDTYLISKYLSTSDLGMYSTSKTLFSTTMKLSLAAVLPVLYSMFAKLKDDNELFRHYVLISQKIVFAISAFIGIGVFVSSDLIELFVFTSDWKGISHIFGPIFLITGFEFFYTVLIVALKAKGEFKLVSLNSIFSIIITIPVLYFSVKYGLFVYIIARSLSLYLYYPIIFYYTKKIINVTFWDCIVNSKYIILTTISILLVYFIVKIQEFSFVIEQLILVVVYLFFVIMFILIEKKFIMSLKTFVKKK